MRFLLEDQCTLIRGTALIKNDLPRASSTNSLIADERFDESLVGHDDWRVNSWDGDLERRSCRSHFYVLHLVLLLLFVGCFCPPFNGKGEKGLVYEAVALLGGEA